jgi:hypothetical protein
MFNTQYWGKGKDHSSQYLLVSMVLILLPLLTSNYLPDIKWLTKILVHTGSTTVLHSNHRTSWMCYNIKFLPKRKYSNSSGFQYSIRFFFVLLSFFVLFHIFLNSNFALSFIILNVLCFKACNFNFHKNIFFT